MFEDPVVDSLAAGAAQWRDHPKFPGVRLAPLVTAPDSGGRFTTLLVSLEPNARMAPHTHPAEYEQHLVLKGGGRMEMDGEGRAYGPGSLAVIPAATEHSVTAGERGMILVAFFSPALP